MSTPSKRLKGMSDKIDKTKLYSLDEALDAIKEVSTVKFVETVEISVHLGVDPRKSDQMVRGAYVLPNGTGKTVRIAVFTQGKKATEATEAGADRVGFDDLASEIKAGKIDFDVLIATPDSMATVGKLGQILGPKGLMPNPKVGTVTANVAKAVADAKSGQVAYRIDKAGILHCGVGKLDFTTEKLKENIVSFLTAVKKTKPSSAKGTYLKKLTLSSTMGPGLMVELDSLGL